MHDIVRQRVYRYRYGLIVLAVIALVAAGLTYTRTRSPVLVTGIELPLGSAASTDSSQGHVVAGYELQNEGFAVLDPTTGQYRELSNAFVYTISPNLRYSFTSDGLIDNTTGARVGDLAVPKQFGNPIWSPDGRWIAFSASRRGESFADRPLDRILFVDLVTGKGHQVKVQPDDHRGDSVYGWTADSSALVVTLSGRSSHGGIMLVETGGEMSSPISQGDRPDFPSYVGTLPGTDIAAFVPWQSSTRVGGNDAVFVNLRTGTTVDRFPYLGQRNAHYLGWLDQTHRAYLDGTTLKIEDTKSKVSQTSISLPWRPAQHVILGSAAALSPNSQQYVF